MEFYKHESLWSLLKRLNCRGLFANSSEFLSAHMQTAENNGDAFSFRRAILEYEWEQKECPYYNVYPAIIPMLTKLKLDIPCSVLKDIAVQPIELRLPKSLELQDFVWAEGRVKSLMVGVQPVPEAIDSEMLTHGLVIAFDIGELDPHGHPILSFKFFPLRDDMTIEAAANMFPPHESINVGVQIPNEVMTAVIKLCACIALIDRDSDIITPDILSKDKGKWDQASEEQRNQMIDKAKSRGKNGWNLGASIEYAPHYRRPHPALVRVGKGRTLARIVMRRGSVVHRSKLIEVPSGYESNSN